MTKFRVLTRDYGAFEVTADSYTVDDANVLYFRGEQPTAAFREWIGVIPVVAE